MIYFDNRWLGAFSKITNPKTMSLKIIFNFQLVACVKLSLNTIPIRPSNKKYIFVEVITKQKHSNFLTKVLIVNLSITFVKGLLILKPFLMNKNMPVTASLLLQLGFCFIPVAHTFCYVIFFSFKFQEFVDFCNSIYSSNSVQLNNFVQFLMYNSPLFSFSLSCLYAGLILFTNVNPITEWLNTFRNELPVIIVAVLSIVISLYEIWSFAIMTYFGSLVAINGMFAGYVGLHHLTKRLLYSIQICKESLSEKYINEYRNLRILTILANDCFQKVVALPLKVLMISTCVIAGVILFESKLRETSTILELYVCLYIIINLYCFIIISYSFPGQAHYNGRKIVEKYKLLVVTVCVTNKTNGIVSKVKEKLLQKYIISCGEIRLKFAGHNFYERNTWIILIEFLLECTLSLVLMI